MSVCPSLFKWTMTPWHPCYRFMRDRVSVFLCHTVNLIMTEHEWEFIDRASDCAFCTVIMISRIWNDLTYISHFVTPTMGKHVLLCNNWMLQDVMLLCSQQLKHPSHASGNIAQSYQHPPPPVSKRFYDTHINMSHKTKWYLPLRLSDQSRIYSSMRATRPTDFIIPLLVWNISQWVLPSQC